MDEPDNLVRILRQEVRAIKAAAEYLSVGVKIFDSREDPDVKDVRFFLKHDDPNANWTRLADWWSDTGDLRYANGKVVKGITLAQAWDELQSRL